MMQSRIISFIAAAAIGLAGLSASPAAARDNSDKTLAILLGLGVAGLLLHEAQKDKRRSPAPAPQPQPARYKTVPGECVYDIQTSVGPKSVISKNCLAEFGLSRLPADCAFDVRSPSGRRTVYGPRCLQGYGYRIGGGLY